MYVDGALISLTTGHCYLVSSSSPLLLGGCHCLTVRWVPAAQLWPATIGRKSGVPGAARTATLDHWALDTG